MPPFSKNFPIDAGIFTAASVDLNASSDLASANPALIAAIVNNTAFPAGPINLGQFSVSASTGTVSVLPTTVPVGSSVTFNLSATAHSGVSIYDTSAAAIGALSLTNTPNLKVTDLPNTRYGVMDFGYTAKLAVDGTQPIGVFGSGTFAANAAVDSDFGVIHGFAADQGADTALEDAFISWRLPRHVAAPGGALNIKPRTWIVYELDGSLGLNLGATMGWNMSYARQLTLPTLPGVAPVSQDLSVKIDAGLSATFGLTVSGKYLVVVANESTDPASTAVRVAVYKQTSSDFNFGLNLSVGVQGSDPTLAADFSGFIAATFGQEGQQVLADVEQWSSDPTSFGQTLAGLIGNGLNGAGTANQLETDLLNAIGVSTADLSAAKTLVNKAITDWNALPTRLSSMLWTFLGNQSGDATAAIASFKTFLTDLSSSTTVAATVADALSTTTFGDSDSGKFLESIAGQGLLSLVNDFPTVSATAQQALDIVNGGLIQKFQAFISQELDLSQITSAGASLTTVGQWLQNRLGNFLGKELDQPALVDLANGIKNLDANVQKYYTAGVTALTKKYSIDFAATFDKATTDTALIDAVFTLSDQAAQALFTQVVQQSKFDDLLTTSTTGVTLNQATLTHEIKRTGTVDLNMPYFDFTQTSVNDSTVTLTAETVGNAVVLFAKITANDTITRANRIASQLSVLASLEFNGKTPVLSNDGGVSYELRLVQTNMGPKDLLARTQTYAGDYLTNLFPLPPASPTATLANFCNTALNPTRDSAVSMQLNLPASLLSGWFLPRDAKTLIADKQAVSLALQRAWRKILPAIHFQNLTNYNAGGVEALLIWSSMPPATSVTLDGGDNFVSSTEGGGNAIFWDDGGPDHTARSAMSTCPATMSNLTAKLTLIYPQLVEAGVPNSAFLAPGQADKLVPSEGSAAFPQFDNILANLLSVENDLVGGAATALGDISAALNTAAVSPTQAIVMLAKGFAGLTETLNKTASGTFFTDMIADIVTPLLLVEASAVLGSAAVKPSALLSFYGLNPGHNFDLGTFVTGSNPTKADVASSQTLVHLVTG